jgi:hypothetical protein
MVVTLYRETFESPLIQVPVAHRPVRNAPAYRVYVRQPSKKVRQLAVLFSPEESDFLRTVASGQTPWASPEESDFLRTVASSQTPWAEQLAVDPSFGYGIFSSHLAFHWHFLVSWATFQFA